MASFAYLKEGRAFLFPSSIKIKRLENGESLRCGERVRMVEGRIFSRYYFLLDVENDVNFIIC